ncbi:hypothetical protein PAPYR_6844 [Paratrimastix pyriformis]|uniref:Uncharacterized protein n=1 Tax=Paratrimastix pyriformis TaxID=342808 RepID=A0ABQ8UEB6_9EUKA|nr:hypothetical protein PAPYR_6844 [Paratrimastix pyriformis]
MLEECDGAGPPKRKTQAELQDTFASLTAIWSNQKQKMGFSPASFAVEAVPATARPRGGVIRTARPTAFAAPKPNPDALSHAPTASSGSSPGVPPIGPHHHSPGRPPAGASPFPQPALSPSSPPRPATSELDTSITLTLNNQGPSPPRSHRQLRVLVPSPPAPPPCEGRGRVLVPTGARSAVPGGYVVQSPKDSPAPATPPASTGCCVIL